jgi:hypothetical protein
VITALLVAATPSPTPTTTRTVDADLVNPGLWGFLALFFLALAVYLLGRSMARRVRAVNQRARLEEEAEAERAAAESEEVAVRRAHAGDASAGDEEPPAQG